MQVALTGAGGLIGSALTQSLTADGHRVRRFVRGAPHGPDEFRWDPTAGTLDRTGLTGVDAVVHLAGAGVGDKRWTAAYKDEIRRSRVAGTRTVATALAEMADPPQVLVSASAIGFYGDTGDEVVDETAAPGDDFLARVVRDWEAATAPAQDAGVRVVHLRTGIVMSDRGGTLGGTVSALGVPVPVITVFRSGLGGPLGSGRQWVSWVSLTDTVAAIRFLIDDGSARGAYNLTAPSPVRNKEWARAIGRALHRPAVIPVPAFALRAALGEFATLGPLISQRVQPRRLEQAGFTFTHTDLDDALRAETGSAPRPASR